MLNSRVKRKNTTTQYTKRVILFFTMFVFVFSSNIAVIRAMSPGQNLLYQQGINYYDINFCSTEEDEGLSAGSGKPDGASFPELDPKAMAEAINKYVAQTNNSSRLKNLGETIVAGAENSNINPFLIVAIAQKESSLSNPSDYNVSKGNNSFGRTATSSQPNFSGARLWYKWTSVKASVDHTANENKNATGGGDIAAYIRAQYSNKVDKDDLVSLMMEYAPPFENDTDQYIADIRSWTNKMIKLTKESTSTSSGTQDNTTNSIKYKAKGNIPLGGKKYTASVYGTIGGKDKNGKYVEYLGGMEGGALDEQGKPLKGRAVVAEMSGNKALGKLPYGEKIEIRYKDKSVIAEVSDNGPGAGGHSDVDLWREVADLLDFPYSKEEVTIRGVDNSTPTTSVDGSATSAEPKESDTKQGQCICTTPINNQSGSGTKSSNEETIYNFYVREGYTPEQAAGFVGNYYQESKYDPTLVNSIGATGLAQWLGGRLTALQNFAKEKGKSATSLLTQLEFSIKELNGSESAANSAIKDIEGSGKTAIERITYIIRVKYERPGEHEAMDDVRIKKALEVYSKYGGGTSGTVVDSGGDTNCEEGQLSPEGSGVSSGKLAWPMDSKYPITSCFGQRWGKLHGGLDISAPAGTPIKAADGGTVEIAGPSSGFGNTVVIKHSDGLWTLYAHMKDGSIKVRTGQKVDQGQVIGQVNNTGASKGDHLHFNVQTGGGASYANAKDPLKYLPKDMMRQIIPGSSNCPSSLT